MRPETLRLPVADGVLEAHRWPGDGPRVLAVHGITANGLAFGRLAVELAGRADLVAVDLRDRAGSATLPGPYGIARHAADCLAVLDRLGLPSAAVVGHSMGASVAAVLARSAPDRVDRLVLVDGGWGLAPPPEVDLDAALAAVLGPALQRLSATFASAAEYEAFWRAHPAFVGGVDETVLAYVRHDLAGEPPRLRPAVVPAAVREDGGEVLRDPAVREAVLGVRVPTVALLAERGMTDQPAPLYPDALMAPLLAARPDLPVFRVAGTNHYTIVLAGPGASVVAAAVLDGPLPAPAQRVLVGEASRR